MQDISNSGGFSGMSIIRTSRFVLRPYERRDATAFAYAVREAAVAADHWLSWAEETYSEQDARSWFRSVAVGHKMGTSHEYGIFSLAEEAFIGGAGLNRIDSHNRLANLGYWVRPTRRRQGVACECASALVEYAFTVLGLQRIEVVVAVGNDASAGVARKLGAHLECVAQNRLRVRGQPVPAYVFALTAHPYERPS
ncbi:GNAT family N-acetyltransferase [Acidiferrobacter sp. SPIII_3]|jgi:RimJ/RimL family protein N-acetyltransferase|nr:GNAT family N-acetyltransferase [Acidiferrobacter sp. SPIII_3]